MELRDLSKVYLASPTPFAAIKEINLNINYGDFLAIMGPSGSGKSTLLNILGLLDKPTTGDYFFEGEDVSLKTDSELAKIRGLKIGFVFQFFNLIPKLTVLQNVEVPMVYAGVPTRRRRQRSIDVLKEMGLTERIDYLPSRLSGGETQRTAIARAIVNNPKVILADEPTGNLDTKTGHEIMDIFLDLNRSGSTIILVTHEQDIADYAHRTVRIKDGRLVENT